MSWLDGPCSGPYVMPCIKFADDVENLRLYQWCKPCLGKLGTLLMERRKNDPSAFANVNSMVGIELAALRQVWPDVTDKECVNDIEAAVRNFIEAIDKFGIHPQP